MRDKDKREFVFERLNYILLIVGVLINFIGYLLMVGGADTDPVPGGTTASSRDGPCRR